MRIANKIIKVFLGVALMVSLNVACSSSEEEEVKEDLQASEEGQAANLENNYGNYGEEGEGGENEYGEDYTAEGENLNNAPDDNLVEELNNSYGSEGYSEEGLAQDIPMNEGANAFSQGNSEYAPEAEAPVNIGPEAPATDTGYANAAPAATAVPSGNGQVRYVISDTAVHTQPDGNVVEQLETGDHPLVYDEGNWVRTSDGYYVKSQSLTDQPVARTRRDSPWQ